MKYPVDCYKVIIWWSKMDSCFLGEIPELVGCAADGATQEEVLANIRVIAREWMEMEEHLGRSIPEPQEVLWPADDPAFASRMERGAEKHAKEAVAA